MKKFNISFFVVLQFNAVGWPNSTRSYTCDRCDHLAHSCHLRSTLDRVISPVLSVGIPAATQGFRCTPVGADAREHDYNVVRLTPALKPEMMHGLIVISARRPIEIKAKNNATLDVTTVVPTVQSGTSASRRPCKL